MKLGPIDTHVDPAPKISPELVGKTVLVTGGAGYVGSTLIERLLSAGVNVRSFDVRDHHITCDFDGEFETVVGDLRDYDTVVKAMDGIDTVFHTAALISTLELYRKKKRDLIWSINVGGTQNVVRAAQGAGVKALVHVSSFIVVLNQHGLDDQDESLPYAEENKDLYTLTKIASEKVVLEGDASDGLRTCAVRPGGIWGPNPHCIMINGILQEIAKKNFKVLIGNPSVTMDNTHVENLVDSMVLGAINLRSDKPSAGGEAFFITDEEPLNPLEWFRPLVEGLGDKFPSVHIPGPVMRGVGRGLEVIHYLGGPEPTLTRRAMRNLTESSSFRVDKARKMIGYEPRYHRANGIPELLPAARDYLKTAGRELTS